MLVKVANSFKTSPRALSRAQIRTHQFYCDKGRASTRTAAGRAMATSGAAPSDRIRVPARPAWHVHRHASGHWTPHAPECSYHRRRCTKPNMTIGPLGADQAGARPTAPLHGNAFQSCDASAAPDGRAHSYPAASERGNPLNPLRANASIWNSKRRFRFKRRALVALVIKKEHEKDYCFSWIRLLDSFIGFPWCLRRISLECASNAHRW